MSKASGVGSGPRSLTRNHDGTDDGGDGGDEERGLQKRVGER